MSDTPQVVCPACHTANRVPALRLGDGPVCGRCKSPLFAGQPVALGENSFGHHLQQSDLPLLVDFWAEWCGPCKMMAPQFAKSAAMLEPRLRLAKVDTEANPRLAAQYGIRSIPTLVLFHQGREAARVSGAMSAEQLVGWVGENLRE